jgi:hypothetical protein
MVFAEQVPETSAGAYAPGLAGGQKEWGLVFQEGVRDGILRAAGALGLAGVALIHFLDLFSKFKEAPYLGLAFLALIGVSLGAAAGLVRSGSRRVWGIAGLAAASAIVGYVISRWFGLPHSAEDVGNWGEPLGLASLFVEGILVVVSGYVLKSRSPAKPQPPFRAVPTIVRTGGGDS